MRNHADSSRRTSESYFAHRIRRRIRSIGEVADCAEVSIGYTRKKLSIRLEVRLRGNPTFEGTHGICSAIEGVVRHIVPNSCVDINSQSSGIDGVVLVWKVVKEIGETLHYIQIGATWIGIIIARL